MANDVPIGLLEQLERGNVLLFAGEGINRGLPNEHGLPPSADLAEELAQRSDYPASDPLTLPHVAYFYERRFGRNALISFLRQRWWDHTLLPLRTHQLIANLPVPVIVTTTYDDMLERIYRQAATPYVAVVSNQDVPYADRRKRLLIWLLGRLDRPESLVLTEPQQAAFLEDQRNLSDVLRAELAQRTWLILGFDLRRTWFRTFYASVMRRLDSHGRRAYFCGESPGGYIAEWCRDHNVEILTPDVVKFLEELSRALAERKQIELPEPEIEEAYPEHPYKGLSAFTATDRRIFFGRERETQRLADLVRAQRSVVLYGASGTGKTSLVQAGLVPLLERGKPPYTAVTVRALGDPAQAVRAVVAERVPFPRKLPTDVSLVDFLTVAIGMLHTPLVIVLDQFEEFFVQRSPELRRRFIAELADVLRARDVPVKIVLSLREEWLASLGEVESAIPGLYDARFRLLPLDREAARAAIEKPVEPFGVRFEPALVDHLLDDLGGGTMMPTQVQLVCEALYNSLPRGQREITLARYVELGGAQGILGHFLKDELARVPENQRTLAQSVLEELVSSQGTKIVKTAVELERALGTDTEQLQPILHTLAGRLLHVIVREGTEPLYELAHEYLVAEIQLSAEAQARKQAEELIAQGIDNWKRLGTLLGPDALAVIEAQRDVLRLKADALELLLWSAVKHGREPEYWADHMFPDARETLIQRLSPRLKNEDREVRREALAILWAMRRYLPRSLCVPVYRRHLAQQAPLAARRWAIPVVLVAAVLAVAQIIIPPADTGWRVMPSFEGISRGLGSYIPVVHVDPINPDLIYASDQAQGGLYRSTDGGVTWRLIGGDQLAELSVRGIAALEKTVYVTTPEGVFISDDMGAHWVAGGALPLKHPDQEPWAVAVSPQNPREAYVGVSRAGVFATRDGGSTWSPLESLDVAGQRIQAIATDGTNVVAALEQGLWISRDAGQTWSTFDAQPAIPAPVTGLSMRGWQTGNFFVAYGESGVGIADVDNGAWNEANEFPQDSFPIVSVSASTDYAYYASSPDNLYCRRVWYCCQKEWWVSNLEELLNLGINVPCRGSGP